jgi:hypothetical protein
MERKWPVPRNLLAPAVSAGLDHSAIPMRTPLSIMTLPVLLLLSALLPPVTAIAEVSVYDSVAAVGREVMLRAETRSGFFSMGGALVEFFLDGKRGGKSLSGADGIASLPFVPMRAGLHVVGAQWEGDKAEGLLLAVTGSTQLVLIDVEGSLREPTSFALKPRAGSMEALTKISRRYPVVFLWTGYIGMGAAKAWLRESGFPGAPLLPWGQGDVLEEIGRKNLRIRAVVGKPEVVQSAKGHTSRAFSFEATGDAEPVQDWDEIVKKISEGGVRRSPASR